MCALPAGLQADDASGSEALGGRGGAHLDLVERLLAVVPELATAAGLGLLRQVCAAAFDVGGVAE